MTIVYTEQSLNSLQDLIYFLIEEQGIPLETTIKLRGELFDKTEKLINQPYLGQIEEYLEHLDKGHRRLIHEHIKIIYRVEKNIIYITDFFDSRQDPLKMKDF